MSKYIRLREDLSVSIERAVEMLNTPVTYTCWAERISLTGDPDGQHHWNGDLLTAELNQNRHKCPVCGEVSKISFKKRRPDDFQEGTFQFMTEKDLFELLAA